MAKTILIHNPRCSKSREAKDILDNEGIDFEIIDYLKDGLKEKLLEHLPELLGMTYKEMIRSKEDIYNQLKLDHHEMTENDWIQLLKKHPILLERPIFIHNEKAVIARPAERLKSLLLYNSKNSF